MDVGEIFEASVRSLSSEGKGVAEAPSGQVFFIEGAWPGDRASFEVVSLKKRYGNARIVKLLEASADRRGEIPCPQHGFGEGQCGGCPWMLASYVSQLQHKEQRVRHALERAGLLNESVKFEKIWASPEEFNYRNRAQFKTDGDKLGFVQSESKKLVDVERCAVLNEEMQRRLSQLRAKLPVSSWKPEDGYIWNFLDLDDSVECSTAKLQINRRRPFRQGNTQQNEQMRKWLSTRVSSLSRDLPVLELFAGSGNFTSVFLGLGFQDICAVEGSGLALDELRLGASSGVTSDGVVIGKTAATSKTAGMERTAGMEKFAAVAKAGAFEKTAAIDPLRPRKLDLAHRSSYRVLAREERDAKILLLDPPREGAAGLGDYVGRALELEHIFYISCDVATLVRDLAELSKHSFALSEVQALDMFPHTAHVEVMCRLKKV